MNRDLSGDLIAARTTQSIINLISSDIYFERLFEKAGRASKAMN